MYMRARMNISPRNGDDREGEGRRGEGLEIKTDGRRGAFE